MDIIKNLLAADKRAEIIDEVQQVPELMINEIFNSHWIVRQVDGHLSFGLYTAKKKILGVTNRFS